MRSGRPARLLSSGPARAGARWKRNRPPLLLLQRAAARVHDGPGHHHLPHRCFRLGSSSSRTTGSKRRLPSLLALGRRPQYSQLESPGCRFQPDPLHRPVPRLRLRPLRPESTGVRPHGRALPGDLSQGEGGGSTRSCHLRFRRRRPDASDISLRSRPHLPRYDPCLQAQPRPMPARL